MSKRLSMQKYLLHSTIIAIFSEAFLFRVGFDLKFMYGMVIVNFLLMISKMTIKMPNKFLLIIGYIGLTGVLSIFLYNNQISKILFQLFGISVISLYFYNFYLNSKYSLFQIFQTYCRYAYWMSIIGLFIFFFLFITGVDLNIRLGQLLPFYGYELNPDELAGPLKVRGLLLEPSHFGAIVLPAFAYSLHNFKTAKRQTILMGLALLLSFSSITYVGIILSLLFLPKKINFIKLGFVGVLCLSFGIIAYNSIDDIKIRINDTFNVLSDSKYNFEGVNLSTYALLSNLYVTGAVFKSNPIIGHGIGSHAISHKMYISGVSGVDVFEELGISDINSMDANSFALRVISELGLIGLCMIFIFLKRNYSSDNYIVSRSLLIYFIYKLIRDGHYFPPEMYFFVFLYYFLNRTKKNIGNVRKNSCRNFEYGSI